MFWLRQRDCALLMLTTRGRIRQDSSSLIVLPHDADRCAPARNGHVRRFAHGIEPVVLAASDGDDTLDAAMLRDGVIGRDNEGPFSLWTAVCLERERRPDFLPLRNTFPTWRQR